VLTDADLLARVRQQARARIAPAMGWSAVADQYVEIYARALAK
jgi:hypothetical protein